MPEVSVDSSLILQVKKLCVSAEKEMKGTIYFAEQRYELYFGRMERSKSKRI